MFRLLNVTTNAAKMNNSITQSQWSSTYNSTGITLVLFVFFLTLNSSLACTVFVITNEKHTYFFNNEDFSNPKTRLWFVPKGTGHYGCAYVGFDDGEAQGGLNTKGLAFEWVTVETDSYTTDPSYIPEKSLARLEVNTSQWMLERCKTVGEAMKFYQTYREPAFARSTLVIVDKAGASVIIGSKNGKIYFDKAHKSRSFGFGEATFQKLYQDQRAIDRTEGAKILKQCVVPGNGGTKYSNSYDLRTGEITFYNFNNENENTRINLTDELKKGGHYYETAHIFSQIQQAIKPLLLNMNRHILFINQALAAQEPAFTAKVKNLFSEVADGKLRYDNLSENFANDLKKAEDKIKAVYGRFGNLRSLELVLKEKNPAFTDYSYVMKFDNVIILWQFLVDGKDEIYDFNTLSVAWKRE